VNLPILITNDSQLSNEVWSDDFENETMTLSQWTFGGMNNSYPDADYTPNIAISNGMLYSDGPDSNEIIHNSTITMGTWSVDTFLNESDSRSDIHIVFLSPYFVNHLFDMQGYSVHLYIFRGDFHIDLKYLTEGTAWQSESIDEYQTTTSSGWRHIDIIRHSNSSMYVYLNGILILQGIDTHLNTSEYFVLTAPEYAVFDNVTVSDNTSIPPLISPPTSSPPSTLEEVDGSETLSPWTIVLLAISSGSSVVIIVVVLKIYQFKRTSSV